MFVFTFNALGLWARVTIAAPADAFVVEVTGQQFAWNVRYPGTDGVFGRTDAKHVEPRRRSTSSASTRADPARRRRRDAAEPALSCRRTAPVRVRLRSLDVIHSFFLPHFRVKQDAMPGMTDRDLVRAQAGGRLRDRLRRALRARATTGCAASSTSSPPPSFEAGRPEAASE